MELTYQTGRIPDPSTIIGLYDSSGIHRPTADPERISGMYRHANLVVSAWEDELLVGIARSLTDFCYCCYLSDLAVRREFQHRGIGKKLIELTKREIGDQTTLILVSAREAMDYYPKIGLTRIDSAFIIRRTS